SVGGVPNSYILLNDGPNDSIATDATACEIKPTWNAAICKGDIGRLTFGGGGGARGAGAGPGTAPARGGVAGPGAVAAGPGGAPRRGAGADAHPPIAPSRKGRESPQTASNERAGTEIKVTTERPSVSLTLTEMDSGSWVIFELPGFTTAASGTPQT